MKIEAAKAALEAEAARRQGERAEAKARNRRARQTKPPSVARRVYHSPDLLRIAYLAGMGMSGGEIATAVGGTTRFRIAALLSKLGLSTVPRRATEQVMRLTIPKATAEALGSIAASRDVNLEVIAADLLAAVAAEPILAGNLLDEQ